MLEQYWWWEPLVQEAALPGERMVDGHLLTTGEHPYAAALYFAQLQEVRNNMVN